MRITAIYDNGDKTLDRYTVVTDEPYSIGTKMVMALGLSDNPTDYNGFSQWTGAQVGRHLGKLVPFEKLPAHLQAHIAQRVFEMDSYAKAN